MDEKTPVAAMDFIESQNLEGRIFHPQIYGDYLIWRLWPKQRSFIDGRVHLFDERVISEYAALFFDSCWEQRLQDWDIRFLLLDRSRPESLRLLQKAKASRYWKGLYSDEISTLLVRLEP